MENSKVCVLLKCETRGAQGRYEYNRFYETAIQGVRGQVVDKKCLNLNIISIGSVLNDFWAYRQLQPNHNLLQYPLKKIPSGSIKDDACTDCMYRF